MHFQAVVTVEYGERLIDHARERPILGYLVVFGVNCGGFSEAAKLVHDQSLRLHGADTADLGVQEIDLTSIDKNDWDAEVKSQVSERDIDQHGIYYSSNLVFLDRLEDED